MQNVRRTREQVLGRMLKNMRMDAGLIQHAVGLHLGYQGQTVISRMENGKRAMRLDEYILFCDATKFDPIQIFPKVQEIVKNFPRGENLE
jgi:hypothetical protein